MSNRNKKKQTKKITLTEDEFCEKVGISRMTAYRLRQKGQIVFCRVGIKILYLPEHVEQFLKSREKEIDPRRRRVV
jgi:excisionase family DNA binding protein